LLAGLAEAGWQAAHTPPAQPAIVLHFSWKRRLQLESKT